MLTKDQERKALEKIKKILADLGPDKEDSYILIAFEGCVEDAEENIENDFSNSWKARANYREKQLTDARKAAASWKEQAETAAAMNTKIFSTADAMTILITMDRDRARQEQIIEESGKRIIQYAENPNTEEFRQAVEENRTACRVKETDEKMIEMIKDKYFSPET